MGRLLRGLALVVVLGGLAALAGSAALQWWEPPDAPPATTEIVANPRERVRVEVLNAGGVAGMARVATEILRDAGFDVVEVGNADAFDRDGSVVFARLGRVDLASMVAEALAIPAYRNEPDSTAYVDVTVLLGSAWDPAVVVERAAEDAQAEEDVIAPEPAWREMLARFREWAEGFGQEGRQ